MSKKMTDENRKLVSEFFRKAQMIARAASEMSAILDAGGPIPNSTKLSAILKSDDEMPKVRKPKNKKKDDKDDIEACKCYILGHMLMINGVEGAGFISKKGNIKKYFDPMKKKHRKMSVTWGDGPVSTASYRFRVRYATLLMSWFLENYDDLYRISKREGEHQGYSGGFIHFIMVYIKMLLDDYHDPDYEETDLFEHHEIVERLGMMWLLVGDDLRKSHIKECHKLYWKNNTKAGEYHLDLEEDAGFDNAKCVKKLIKYACISLTGHSVKIPGKINKSKNILDNQNGREMILRAIGDVIITCADEGDISPIYLAYVRSDPKLIGYSSRDDRKVRAGRQALNYILYVQRDFMDKDLKNFIKKVLR